MYITRAQPGTGSSYCIIFLSQITYSIFNCSLEWQTKVLNIFFQPEKQCLAEESCGRRSSRTDRTTRMLLAVLGLFLSTEVPQGLLGLASALAPDFFKNCYSMFGE